MNTNNNVFIKIIKDWIIPIVCAIILATLINKFLIFKVVVPTGSMEPTVMPGNQIFAVKIYNPSKIKRGQIVVFKKEGEKELLLKRVIGLPGDTIQIKDGGKVYINGELLNEPYVKYSDPLGGTFHVPEGEYFMLGDNRANSRDSRYWKDPYIPGGNIIAKAWLRVYPFDKIGFLKDNN
ncbi:signal peptidase I [uncultured Clostridium sp.]|jgi:signal peptidase I|uniref:signal peptidase I n=1 Tax=uncultured Clostridium sp. TaxID=59620 RepID=UPI00260FA9B3|nr:signal peptidase I [uncultured Clostridium sp.]